MSRCHRRYTIALKVNLLDVLENCRSSEKWDGSQQNNSVLPSIDTYNVDMFGFQGLSNQNL